MSQELSLKVVVTGDSSVGKTCISLRYLTGEFSNKTTPTIAAGFCNSKVKIGKHNINLLIWDTAGQEAYRSLTSQYYRETKIALIVFDVTNPQTLESVTDWHERICEVNEGTVVTVLVGNKIDLPNRRISCEQGEKIAESIGALYRETSALSGKGVNEVFDDACAEYVRANPLTCNIKQKANVDLNNTIKEEKSCC